MESVPGVIHGSIEEEAGKNRGWLLGPFKPEGTPHCTGVQVKYDRTQTGACRPRGEASCDQVYHTLQIVVSGQATTSFPGATEEDDVHIPVPAGHYCLWRAGVKHYWRIDAGGLVITVRWPASLSLPSNQA